MNQRFKFSSVNDERAFVKDEKRYLPNSAENSTCILDFGFFVRYGYRLFRFSDPEE